MKGFDTPDPHEMDPHTLPTKILFELYCRFLGVGVIRVYGNVTAIGSVVIHSWSMGVVQNNNGDTDCLIRFSLFSRNRPTCHNCKSISATDVTRAHIMDHACKCPHLICAPREPCRHLITICYSLQ
jgi:hypothetical protein